MARRLVAARRRGCRQPQPVSIAPPPIDLSRERLPDSPHLLRPNAIPLMAACWAASAAVTPLTASEHQCLATGDTDAIFTALVGREQRRVDAAIAKVLILCGDLAPITIADLHVTPLLNLAHVMRSGDDVDLGDPSLVVELTNDFCVEASIDFSSVPGRALLAIWSDLVKTNRYLVSPAHTFEAVAPWVAEHLSDAARDGRWESDEFIPDPDAVNNFMEEQGYEDRELAIEHISAYASHLRTLDGYRPLSVTSTTVRHWITANPGPVAERLKALAKLARLARTDDPSLHSAEPEFSGQVGVIGCLLPPMDASLRVLLGHELEAVGQGEFEQISLDFPDLTQLFTAIPHAAMELAIAHAALTLAASLHTP